jgi:hypothetical protein
MTAFFAMFPMAVDKVSTTLLRTDSALSLLPMIASYELRHPTPNLRRQPLEKFFVPRGGLQLRQPSGYYRSIWALNEPLANDRSD